MIAVIFEVEPKDDESRRAYFDIAVGLRAELEKIDGFISVERFESVTNKGKYLSLSYWRDEAAVTRWRELAEHRAAQERGKAELFAGYRIRVAEILRDYGMDGKKR